MVLFDLTHFASAGDRAGQRLIRLLKLPSAYSTLLRQIGHARWGKTLSKTTLVELVDALHSRPETASNGLVLLDEWMQHNRGYSKTVEDRALESICNKSIIASNGLIIPTSWKNMCLRLIPNSAQYIAVAIFECINSNGNIVRKISTGEAR